MARGGAKKRRRAQQAGKKEEENASDTGGSSSSAESDGGAAATALKRMKAGKAAAAHSDKSAASERADSTSTGGHLPNESLRVHKRRWTNRTRVLVFCSRGCSFKERHLVNDLRQLMPHAKAESKMDNKLGPSAISESAELRNCDKCIFVENRKRRDAYLWMANIAGGPTVKFHLLNVHTMSELRMAGNCLRGSRPLLCFDSRFDAAPHLRLLKELMTQILGTPAHHPRSQPFTDRVLNLSLTDDDRLWFRNYQIVDAATGQLEEIGPRFVLEIVKMFEGSFGGSVIYENARYVNPNVTRRQLKAAAGLKYAGKLAARFSREQRARDALPAKPSDGLDAVFDTGRNEDGCGGAEAAKIRRAIEKRPAKKGKMMRKKMGKGKAVENGERMEA